MPEFAARLPLEPSTPPPPRQAWATQISPAKSEPAKSYRQPPALPSDDTNNSKPAGWSPPTAAFSRLDVDSQLEVLDGMLPMVPPSKHAPFFASTLRAISDETASTTHFERHPEERGVRL